MKKEKQVKSYQRRTKSGKMITVKSYTAKYDNDEPSTKKRRKQPHTKDIAELNEEASKKFERTIKRYRKSRDR